MKTLCVLSLLLATAGPVAAEDYVGFQSPTGDIHCVLMIGEGGAEARCDLRDDGPNDTPRPVACDLDWGKAFVVGASGQGARACVGDTLLDPSNPVLPYGQALSLGGILCRSAASGMTCTNAEGHGFTVATGKATVY